MSCVFQNIILQLSLCPNLHLMTNVVKILMKTLHNSLATPELEISNYNIINMIHFLMHKLQVKTDPEKKFLLPIYIRYADEILLLNHSSLILQQNH